MRRNPVIAGALSLFVPGLGQIYGGKNNKGAAVIVAAVVIGSLNIIVLPLISLANPVIPEGVHDARAMWAYWIPRVFHDVIALWSVAFWVWAVVDAIVLVKKGAGGSSRIRSAPASKKSGWPGRGPGKGPPSLKQRPRRSGGG